MVFGSVFEVSFRASAVFLCVRDRKHSVIGGIWRSMVYNSYSSSYLLLF